MADETTNKFSDSVDKFSSAVEGIGKGKGSGGGRGRDLSNVQRDEKGRIQKKEQAAEEKKERKRLVDAILGLSVGIDGLKKGAGEGAKKVSKGLGPILGGLLGGGVLAALGGFFGPEGRLPLFAAKILSLSDDVLKIVGKITPFLGTGGKIAGIGLKFLGPLMVLIDGITGAIKGFIGSDEGNIGARLMDAVKGGFAQIIQGITFGLISYDTVTEFLDPLFEPIKGFFGNVAAIFSDPELGIFQKLGLIFEEYIFMLKDTVGSIFERIGTLFSIVFDTIKDNFSVAGIANLISTAAQGISDAFTKIGEFIFEKFKFPITFFAMKIDEIVSIIKEQFFSLAAGVIDLVPDFFKTEGMERMQADFAKQATDEAVNREATRRAYMDNLAAIQEEEFQEQVASQKARLERLKRYGDPSAFNRELERMDKRFGDPRDAARARKLLGAEDGNLLERMPTEAELKAQQDATTAAEGVAQAALQNTVTVVDNSSSPTLNMAMPRPARSDAQASGAAVAAAAG